MPILASAETGLVASVTPLLQNPSMIDRQISDQGGPAMAWAWDRIDERMVHLEVGAAESMRHLARSGRLICPFADCDHPDFTTRVGFLNRNGTWVRDGFRHLSTSAGAHAAESEAHVAAKCLVAAWMKSIGLRDVAMERYDTQAERTPDVSGTIPGVGRIAVEVQYSKLAQALWQTRDDDLRSSGFLTEWLWGHRAAGVPGVHGSHVPQSPEVGESRVGLAAIHQATLAKRKRLWWVDPEAQQIAIAEVQPKNPTSAPRKPWKGPERSALSR